MMILERPLVFLTLAGTGAFLATTAAVASARVYIFGKCKEKQTKPTPAADEPWGGSMEFRSGSINRRINQISRNGIECLSRFRVSLSCFFPEWSTQPGVIRLKLSTPVTELDPFDGNPHSNPLLQGGPPLRFSQFPRSVMDDRFCQPPEIWRSTFLSCTEPP